ncbi:hypothetical protein ABZ832_26970 [Streptantibioticus parmotrematis]|uniref:hypothetical protein n=1 Tax=Streptantibioticus parmotrematis TaxID=2873249 RepID=UPI0033C145C5
MAVFGAVLILVALVGIPRLRVYGAECDSLIGQLAQYGSQSTSLKCTTVDYLLQAKDWILAWGAFSLLGGAFLMAVSRTHEE